jgi:hypothetical protein
MGKLEKVLKIWFEKDCPRNVFDPEIKPKWNRLQEIYAQQY